MKKNRMHSWKELFLNYGILILCYFIVQFFLHSGSVSSLMKGLLVPLCIYSILAISLNLVVGISGELSLGHAGFMCVGAFSSATCSMLLKGSGLPPILLFVISLLVGAVTAGLLGVLIGIPVLRLKGDYLAIVTLAFGEIIKNLINALYLDY